jgi:hypothetical protein
MRYALLMQRRERHAKVATYATAELMMLSMCLSTLYYCYTVWAFTD